MSEKEIRSVAVLGAGTMGSGIAALCASAGCDVILLDVSEELAQQSRDNMLRGKMPMLDSAEAAARISSGSFSHNLKQAAQADWICEAVIEDLSTKQELFAKLDSMRKSDSIVTTNTSGILLRSITQGLSENLLSAVAVTHFFNPVKVMRLLEIVGGEQTSPATIALLAHFARTRLGKGVVYAKDTVNFIGNRIGCFWMLAGLHRGQEARKRGLSVERIDALLSVAFGCPSTGLYGLIDLIGLDVLHLVAINLQNTLPAGDPGRVFAQLPSEDQSMLDRGQLGRKSGGGYFRMLKNEDGSRKKEMYDPQTGTWHTVKGEAPDQDGKSLLFGTGNESELVWDLVADTLCYAADLVPEIADDIVNIDRAMRWGFNWQAGPFQMLDDFGPEMVIKRLEASGRSIPKMLSVLRDSAHDNFYTGDGLQYLGTDGQLHRIPPE